MRLSIRESARGNQYLTGYLGLTRVVAFKAKELDKHGNEQWELYVSEQQQRDQQTTAPRRDLPVCGQGTNRAVRERADEVASEILGTKAARDRHIQEWADRFDERGPDEVPS